MAFLTTRMRRALPRYRRSRVAFDTVDSPSLGSVPIAVAVPRGEQTLLEFFNAVVADGHASGLFANRLDYWIKGGGTRTEREPRWSIGGNVLGLWNVK